MPTQLMPPEEVGGQILVNVLLDVQHYRSLTAVASAYGDRRGRGIQLKHGLAKQNACLYAPGKWLGHNITKAESKQFAKMARQLENEGLIHRITDSRGRTERIVLLPEGEELARSILAEFESLDPAG